MDIVNLKFTFHQYKSYIIITSVCVVIMLLSFVYNINKCENKEEDGLLKSIDKKSLLSGWSLLHFVTFALLSYYYPGDLIFLIIVSVIWQSIMWLLKYNLHKISLCNYKVHFEINYLLGCVLMNIIGLLLGYSTSKFKNNSNSILFNC